MIVTLLLHKKILGVIFIFVMGHGLFKGWVASRNRPKDDEL